MNLLLFWNFVNFFLLSSLLTFFVTLDSKEEGKKNCHGSLTWWQDILGPKYYLAQLWLGDREAKTFGKSACFQSKWTGFKLSLVGEKKCVVRNNPARKQLGKEKFKKHSRQPLPPNFFKFFLAGASRILTKCTNSCQNEPKCVNSWPWWGKSPSNSSPGHPGKKKFLFSSWGILAGPRPVPPYPVSRKNTQWLSLNWVKSKMFFFTDSGGWGSLFQKLILSCSRS